jgi:hypothetical protein
LCIELQVVGVKLMAAIKPRRAEGGIQFGLENDECSFELDRLNSLNSSDAGHFTYLIAKCNCQSMNSWFLHLSFALGLAVNGLEFGFLPRHVRSFPATAKLIARWP